MGLIIKMTISKQWCWQMTNILHKWRWVLLLSIGQHLDRKYVIMAFQSIEVFFTMRTFRSRWNISNLPSDSYPFFCNFLRFAHFADTHISKPYFEPSSTGSVSCVVFSKGEAHRVFLRSLFFDSYYLWNAFSMKSIQMKHFKPFVH